jgi:ankyrin repeat protein
MPPKKRLTKAKLEALNVALADAVKANDLDAMRSALDQGADPCGSAMIGRLGTRLLDAAFEKNNPAAMRMLIEAGAPPKLAERDPISTAQRYGLWKCIPMLFELGYRVDPESDRRDPIVRIAAAEGKTDVLRLLLALGSDPNAGSEPGAFSALHLAVRQSHWDCAMLLIEAGADLNRKCGANQKRPRSAFAELCNAGPSATHAVLFALERGALPNTEAPFQWNEEHPFFCAVYSSELVVVKALVAAGANVQARCHWGSTALHAASRRLVLGEQRQQTIAIIDLLVGLGLDVNGSDNQGNTPLHAFVDGSFADPIIPTRLMQLGAECGRLNHQGDTALHRVHDTEIAQALLDAGCDPFVKNAQGEYPSHPLFEEARLKHEAKAIRANPTAEHAKPTPRRKRMT